MIKLQSCLNQPNPQVRNRAPSLPCCCNAESALHGGPPDARYIKLSPRALAARSPASGTPQLSPPDSTCRSVSVLQTEASSTPHLSNSAFPQLRSSVACTARRANTATSHCCPHLQYYIKHTHTHTHTHTHCSLFACVLTYIIRDHVRCTSNTYSDWFKMCAALPETIF